MLRVQQCATVAIIAPAFNGATPMPTKNPHRRVQSFCDELGICRGTFYNRVRAGTGPRVAKIGSRTIVIETPAEYLARMETRALARA